MSTFTTWIERDGKDVPVLVEYQFITPRRATQYEPAEGGVEIDSVTCEVPLTNRERICAEQECVDMVWDIYHDI